jgi:CheY-like chemotaxis protein/predicted regulator of Ras-like GTPase activity (Roadblock/LC7/MglB family)
MVTVLIVDDEAPLLRNLASFLESFGDEFRVRTASSGEEALELLEEDRSIELLLTDIRMPGIHGIELVRRARESRPEVGLLVMTAFGSSELRTTAWQAGAIRFIEKPLDLDRLRLTLIEVARCSSRRSQEVGGLDVREVAQLLLLSGESRVIEFSSGSEIGHLAFSSGALVHCHTRSLEGADAFYEMALWGEGSFAELLDSSPRDYPENVDEDSARLLGEAGRLARIMQSPDPGTQAASPPDLHGAEDLASPTPGAAANELTKKERVVMAIKDHLQELTAVEGFKAAAVFSPQGEMIESVVQGDLDIRTVGAYANNALLNAQKATDQMGVGRGNLVQIRAPQAVALMRCLNEATDFAVTKTGKAHIHAVVIMDPEGNVGMAVMMMDKLVGKVAEELR